MQTIFSLSSLDCASCAMSIEGTCENIPGVKQATVHIAKKTLVVEHESSVQPEVVRSTLQQSGYVAELLT